MESLPFGTTARNCNFYLPREERPGGDNTDLSLQVNSNEAGKLVVAFAGEEPAMVGTAICLSFQAMPKALPP